MWILSLKGLKWIWPMIGWSFLPVKAFNKKIKRNILTLECVQHNYLRMKNHKMSNSCLGIG